MKHLLVTNDFPPKVGGIQSYLWELWRRLPPEDFAVLTTPHPDAPAFDRAQPYRVERTRQKVLLPTPGLRRRIDALAAEIGAEAVVLDPALPLGLLGPALSVPYALVVHGSELLGRLPVGSAAMGRVVRGARLVVAAGGYPASEARRVGGARTPPVANVPPGVDPQRFRPLTPAERASARERFGYGDDDLLVVGVSRLVPRKGFDVLIDAVARLAPDRPHLRLAIAGSGRDHDRLVARIRRTGAPARLVGRVGDDDLPALYGCADLFAMVCRANRWFGLEVEGFGIVFLEAAACGVAQVAGLSGGSADAVEDGATGVVVDRPGDVGAVAAALAGLLDDPDRRARLGAAARERAASAFAYDVLAERLRVALAGMG